jgi:hypothetical protein
MSARHRDEPLGGIGRLSGWACVGLVLLVVVGCGPRTENEAVSGRVTWKGQPLDQGTIEFAPTEGQEAQPAVLLIKDGRYELPRPPGLALGSYQVRISSRQGKAPRRTDIPDADLADPTVKERIPPRYNLKTELKAEVKKGGGNTFDFKLD